MDKLYHNIFWIIKQQVKSLVEEFVYKYYTFSEWSLVYRRFVEHYTENPNVIYREHYYNRATFEYLFVVEVTGEFKINIVPINAQLNERIQQNGKKDKDNKTP